jgi:hypothetical protein
VNLAPPIHLSKGRECVAAPAPGTLAATVDGLPAKILKRVRSSPRKDFALSVGFHPIRVDSHRPPTGHAQGQSLFKERAAVLNSQAGNSTVSLHSQF